MSFLSRVLPDRTPWRTLPDFRRLWVQGVVTSLGGFMAVVALPLQIKELTGSPFAVGAMGLVELVPLVVCGLYGGALADVADRRRVILLTEAGLGVLAAVLFVNALLPHPSLWPLYVVAAGVSGLSGLQRPALDALIARIVPHEQVPAAAALNSLRANLGAIAGPSLAGVVVASAGTATAYALTTAGFAVSVMLCRRLSPAPARSTDERPSLRGIAEGAAYAWSRPVLLGTYAVDMAAMLFAVPDALFPFLADDLGAPWALGFMYAAISLGSLLVGLTSGWVARVRAHGLLVVGGAAAWGLAIAAAGWSANVWLLLFFLVLAGAGDMVSGLGRSTIWNQTIPDGLRGRLAGIEVLSFSTGPQLGQLRGGTVAGWTGARTALWSGGLACVAAVGLLAAVLPKMVRYDAETDADALRRRAEKQAGEHLGKGAGQFPVPPAAAAPAEEPA
ncbi:MFS transporter [Streptomyces sp. NPDC088923]|uniref:MFS transporter n=1 Tax=Streptomyces sp. NPDC088923 TaxID=3365913 RepID=UPI0037FE876B